MARRHGRRSSGESQRSGTRCRRRPNLAVAAAACRNAAQSRQPIYEKEEQGRNAAEGAAVYVRCQRRCGSRGQNAMKVRKDSATGIRGCRTASAALRTACSENSGDQLRQAEAARGKEKRQRRQKVRGGVARRHKGRRLREENIEAMFKLGYARRLTAVMASQLCRRYRQPAIHQTTAAGVATARRW